MQIEKKKTKIMNSGTITVPKSFYKKLGVYEITYLYDNDNNDLRIDMHLQFQQDTLKVD